ncbi:hypothetical protein GH714_016396 [Hevea brasiliensis]|uniref:Uncharacterized protein n=1 Tax=Hevea brasiliensis TaxID=3981 RepID=A0A6A6MDZ1_HEVBR|nr:hypothetical protein GH714_016396 [Hevea brasiliensis]
MGVSIGKGVGISSGVSTSRGEGTGMGESTGIVVSISRGVGTTSGVGTDRDVSTCKGVGISSGVRNDSGRGVNEYSFESAVSEENTEDDVGPDNIEIELKVNSMIVTVKKLLKIFQIMNSLMEIGLRLLYIIGLPYKHAVVATGCKRVNIEDYCDEG